MALRDPDPSPYGEAGVAATAAEVDAMSLRDLKFVFAISYAQAIQTRATTHSALRSSDREARVTVARVLAEVA